jgi:hypothetical protein
MAKRVDQSGKCTFDWLFLASVIVVGLQLAILMIRWLRRAARKEYTEVKCRQADRPVGCFGDPMSGFPTERSLNSDEKNKHQARNLPNPIVKVLYLEITNIAQGANIAILVYVITTHDFLTSWVTGYFSSPLFAFVSLIIVIIFWARYYLDTEILNRSFTILSTFWFFVYVVAEGVSISLLGTPCAWLGSTGVFLFFGAGSH